MDAQTGERSELTPNGRKGRGRERSLTGRERIARLRSSSVGGGRRGRAAGRLIRTSAGAHRALLLPVIAATASVGVIAFEFVDPVWGIAPTGRAILDTVVASSLLAAAWLVRAQFAYSRRLRDVALFAALLTLCVTYCSAYAVPAALNLPSNSALAASGFSGDLVVAALFLAFALAPADRLVSRDVPACEIALGVSLGAVAAAELGGWLLRSYLLGDGSSPRLMDAVLRHPLALTLVLSAAALFVVAAVGVVRGQAYNSDGLNPVLATAAVLMAAARLHSLALPSTASQLIAPRDGLRLAAAGVVLLAAVRRERRLPAVAARAAAVAERRRVARNLHDGLAQDLALIAAHSPRIAAAMGEGDPVVLAAQHALSVSRGALTELSGHADVGAHEALEALASDLRRRFQIAVTLEVDLKRELAPPELERVIGIVREAIANACRHGAAQHVAVSLRQTVDGTSLRITDDGRGIAREPQTGARRGFGMRMMRERASELGGRMTLVERERGGTEVEVRLP